MLPIQVKNAGSIREKHLKLELEELRKSIETAEAQLKGISLF